MSSQLNPNAAEFVPVSPTRLLMLDDAIISASPGVGFEKSLDDVKLPTAQEFASEISQRPGDIEIANGPKSGDDYFMRDNFSTLRNKKDLNVSSTCAVFGDDSVRSFSSDIDCLNASASESVPFDQLEAVQNIEEKVTSAILDKENMFPTGEISNNAFGMTNIFDKNDPMITSTTDIRGFSSSPEPEDGFIPGTPKSTTVEAPVSPINASPLHQTELDSPTDDYVINAQKSPELISPGDGPQDNVISGQERTSSSGFESESGPEEGDNNVPEDTNEGFITEHRRSPPIDLSFKPIQTFSDTNPFGALQTPSSTTPLDQFDVISEVVKEHTEPKTETPMKEKGLDQSGVGNLDFLQNTPSSFISLRNSVPENTQVPFDELESPKESIHFEPIPNANSSPLASDLLKSPEPIFEDNATSVKHEPLELDLSEGTNPEYEETSFTNKPKEATPVSFVDLDTTAGFLEEEAKILKDEKEFEQFSKLIEGDIKDDLAGFGLSAESEDVSPKVVEQVLAAFDDIKDDHEADVKSHESDFEQETKEMKLEFESHIASGTNSEELKNIEESFEVINKDELGFGDGPNTHSEMKERPSSLEELEQDVKETQLTPESTDLLSPSKQTNPFMTEDTQQVTEDIAKSEPAVLDEVSTPVETTLEKNLMSAIDDFNSALIEESVTTEQVTDVSSPVELPSPVEPLATKTVTYQQLTPADEPKLTKSELYVTGVDEVAQEATTPIAVDTEEKTKVDESPVVEEQPVVVEKQPDVVEEQPVVFEEQPVVVKEPVQEIAYEPEKLVVPEETVLLKSEPVQSQVVTETLITALEETSEVPSVTAEAPTSAGTPPPTPAPGAEEDKDDSHKTDILVAAVAAAGAVAAGTAIVADKEAKKAAAPIKKPAVGGAKPLAPGAKAPVKAPAATKAPTAKPSTTTKPAVTATKPTSAAAKPTGTASKPASAAAPAKAATTKPASATAPAKKPTTTTGPASKPTTAATKPLAAKPTTTAAPKPAAAATAPKQVPNKLAVTKTSTLTTLKPSSKPTTPTTPKSPGVVKSPPRLAAKTTAAKPLGATKPAGEKSLEKKPLANGEVKPLVKKEEVKKVTPTTTKPSTTARPSTAPPAKPAVGVKTTTITAKTTVTKTAPATSTQPKTKTTPVTTTTTKPAAPSATAKRPTSAPAAKPTEKTNKDAANKQISNKPAVNGKVAPAKTAVKKTDAKVNGKTPPGKPAPIKKPDDMNKEEEKPAQIQEENVTTTNGYAEHIMEEHGSFNIEELVPAVVDNVN